MGKRLRAGLMAAGAVLVLGGGIFEGYGKYTSHRARESRIGALVQRFKGCPERFSSGTGECFTPEEKQGIVSNAQKLSKQGDFERAGMEYAKLPATLNEARQMAQECRDRGNDEGAERIRNEYELRQEAVSRAMRELNKSR